MLIRRFAAAAVCLLSLIMTNVAGAAPPRAIITGPTGGVPGDILLLDASETDAEFFDWAVEPELESGRTTIMPLEGGRKCIVASVPGTRTIILAVSSAEGIDQLKWQITVTNPGPDPGPAPGPDPEPNPGPSPNPPTPPGPDNGVYGLALFAREQALTVQSANRAAEAHKLAEGFEGVAAAIAAGTIATPQQILAQLLKANVSALGASLMAWRSAGTAIGQRLQQLYDNGRGEMTTTDEWAAALRAIADGLKTVN